MKRLELAGKVFGRLTALHDSGTKYFSNRVWTCQCSCGNIVDVPAAKLVSGHTKSCGCLLADTLSAIKRIRPFEALYNKFVLNNRQRQLVDLSYEEFVHFTKEDKCVYCGDKVVWTEHNASVNSQYNLDRVDNSKGYTNDNCVVCCGICNRMKGVLTFDEFIERVRKISGVHLYA